MSIARHNEAPDKRDIWAQLSANVPASIVQWRQQGKPKSRDGKFFAPFVAYIDAQFVRERLDTVVPGEWDLHLELLPSLASNGDGEAMDEPCAFKARLQILGVIREDVGTGRDYKNASTDAFKRAAVRFGIGHELYTDYEILWVQVDSDSKYARPVEDPAEAYARKLNRIGMASDAGQERSQSQAPSASATQPAAAPTGPLATDEPSCPKCGGRMWDNRLSKRNPKAPDYKCRSRSCDGVIWPAGSKRSRADDEEYQAPDDEREIPF